MSLPDADTRHVLLWRLHASTLRSLARIQHRLGDDQGARDAELHAAAADEVAAAIRAGVVKVAAEITDLRGCANCAMSFTGDDALQHCGHPEAPPGSPDITDHIGGPARAARPRWCPGWTSDRES